MAYVRKVYNLLIGDRTAEEAKLEIGSAYKLEEEMTMEVRGRDLISGLPRSAIVSSEEIRDAIHDPVMEIVEAVKLTLEQTPPELAADIMERGIVLAERGIKVLPDILANAGGVVVSYFEWVQNLQNEQWEADHVDESLRKHIYRSTDAVIAKHDEMIDGKSTRRI